MPQLRWVSDLLTELNIEHNYQDWSEYKYRNWFEILHRWWFERIYWW